MRRASVEDGLDAHRSLARPHDHCGLRAKIAHKRLQACFIRRQVDVAHACKRTLNADQLKGIRYSYDTHTLFAPRSLNGIYVQMNTDSAYQEAAAMALECRKNEGGGDAYILMSDAQERCAIADLRRRRSLTNNKT